MVGFRLGTHKMLLAALMLIVILNKFPIGQTPQLDYSDIQIKYRCFAGTLERLYRDN